MTTAALYSPPRKWQAAPWPEPGEPPFDFNRNEPAIRQSASWTCAAASLAWVMNALGEEAPDGGQWDEWVGVEELRRMGGPGAISPDYGLAYATGVDLERVYRAYGYGVERRLVDWADLVYLTELGLGQLGGARWYHWTGVRGYDSLAFNLANPALTWKGVGDELDAVEWNAWGRWNAVIVVGKDA